jgi:hypothetical protein
MVSIVTSQIRQITERFIHQPGLLISWQDTRYGMNGFTVSDLKLQYIDGSKIKLIKMPLRFIGE